MPWARRRLDALQEIASNVHPGAHSRSNIGCLEQLTEVLDADRCTLYLIEGDKLHSTVILGDTSLQIELEIGQGLAGWVAMAGVPLRINDVLKDDRFDGRWDRASGYTTDTVLAAPLLTPQGQVIGVLQLLNKPGGFDDHDLRYVEAAANLFALAVQAAAH